LGETKIGEFRSETLKGRRYEKEVEKSKSLKENKCLCFVGKIEGRNIREIKQQRDMRETHHRIDATFNKKS